MVVLCEFAKRKKNLKLQALHINYGLRGGDSDADEAFCRALCERMNVPLDVANFAGKQREKAGIQEWARDIRRTLHAAYSAKGWIVATGHHQEDLAETILFRLIRGFSSGNLAGMEQWNGTYWRPFIDTSKADILQFLASRNQDWRHDASNDSRDYARNRLRHDVIPVLRAIAPHAVENICFAGREAAAVGSAFLQSGRKSRTGSDVARILQMQPDAAKYALRSHILALAGQRELRVSRPLLMLVYDQLRHHNARKAVFDLSSELAVTVSGQKISLTKRRPSVKAARITQYASQSCLTDLHALAGAESYVFLRDTHAVWCVGPSGKSKGHSLEFEVKSARSGSKLKLPGWASGRSLKNIFQELSVPPEKRAQFRIVSKNGSQSALFDGEKFINPANLAMQATIEGINFILSKKA
jgi:tRNA(Ile)-lysidine synthase